MNLLYNDLTKLRVENWRRYGMIKNPDQRNIREMVEYMGYSKLSSFELQVVRKDLIGMAEQAAEEGSTIAEKLGVPLKEFCDSVIQNGRRKSAWEILVHTLLCTLPLVALLTAIVLGNENVNMESGVPTFLLTANILGNALIFGAAYLRAKLNFCKNPLLNLLAVYGPYILIYGILFLIPAEKYPILRMNMLPINFKTVFIILLVIYLVLLICNAVHWNRVSKQYDWK